MCCSHYSSSGYNYSLGITGGGMLQYGYTKWNNPETLLEDTQKWKHPDFSNALKKFFFMPDGSFSVSRIVVLLVVITSISALWIGILGYALPAFTDQEYKAIEIPKEVYTYIGALSGEGVLQYCFGKLAQNRTPVQG
jgi:hypothetical protein